MTADITPAALSELIRPHLATGLVGFDLDGLLAPLGEHVDDALAVLAGRTTVAILSGHSVDVLDRRFGFGEGLEVIGSHGLERRGASPPALDEDEQYTFEQLEIIGSRGVAAAGTGARLEYKPTGVVLHTRSADPSLAAPAVEAVANLAAMIDGAQVKQGSETVELLARTASKGQALLALAAALDRSPVVYLGGDDVTVEDAFRMMSDADISVRVGAGDSAARFRLARPSAVAGLLEMLATAR